jgi:hypothetical protein
MPLERDPRGLATVQRAMAHALRPSVESVSSHDEFAGPANVAVSDRLAVYANNARQFFHGALALTYPVLRRRVGEDFFRQLAHEYRAVHPSRSGDLHWVGEAFPGWLVARLDDNEYAWLADLARLEWACEEAVAEATEPALPLATLGRLPPEALDGARLRLQPSLRRVESRWPIWSVWQANQNEATAAPVDLAAGPERCACVCTSDDGVAVYRLDVEDSALLGELHGGATFAEAVSRSNTSPDVLARLVAWAFGEGLVVAVSPSAPA